MLKDSTITGLTLDEAHPTMGACDSCEYAKTTRKPIGKERDPPRRENLGDEVHTDLWGPSPVQTPGYSQYYVSFTNDHMRYTTLYLQKTKAETFASYKSYEAWLSTQFDVKIKRLCSDRSGEYLSKEFNQHLQSRGTERHVTVHDMPEHNGIAEQLNCTLVECVCMMVHASGLLKNLWGKVIMHATWLKNRSSTRRLRTKTLYKIMYKKAPNLSNLPVWGCRVKVHDTSGSKLDEQVRDGHWVGFDAESDGHRMYWPDSRTVGVERSVVFEKRDVFVPGNRVQLEGESGDLQNGRAQPQMQPQMQTLADTAQRTPAITVEQHAEMETASHAPGIDHLGPTFETPPPPHRSTRQHFESDYTRRLCTREGTCDGRITLNYMRQLHDGDSHHNSPKSPENATLALIEDELAADDDVEDVYAMVVGVSEAEGLDLSTVSEARTRLDWPRWEIAINAELKSLEDTRTWDVVECPNGVNVVGNKWVFKIKRNATGEIKKYKACLVAKGYSQVQGVDYDDTYAPVAQLSSLCTILAIAACNNWDIEVFDFHSAFLNSKLSKGEDIYMQLPEGYATNGKYMRPVTKLNVTLYGSKQGALRWYQELSKSLGELRLTRAHADWGVFYSRIGHDILMLASHVDDCTVTGNSAALI